MGHINSGPLGEIYYDDFWEYDPSSDSWSQIANYPGLPGCGPVSFVIDGFAYVGAYETDPSVNTTDFYRYDPTSNSWNAISPVPTGMSDMSAFAIDGKGYYLDGTTGWLIQYDPGTDSWVYHSAPPEYIYNSAATFVIDNQAYFVSYGPITLRFDPAFNTWEYLPPFPGTAFYGFNGFAVHGKGYVIGGYAWDEFGGYEATKEFWEFDPATSSWIQREDFPGSKRRVACAFTINDIAYYGLGTNGTNFNDLWAFSLLLSDDKLPTEDIPAPYPNQFGQSVTFNIGDSFTNTATLLLYDGTGRVVASKEFTDPELLFERGDLESGTYFYKITSSSEVLKSGKLVLQ